MSLEALMMEASSSTVIKSLLIKSCTGMANLLGLHRGTPRISLGNLWVY
jgi:hypothetical protein